MLNFEQFVQSKKFVKDFPHEDYTSPCMVYDQDCYIELEQNYYLLTLGNCQWSEPFAGSIERLERILYEDHYVPENRTLFTANLDKRERWLVGVYERWFDRFSKELRLLSADEMEMEFRHAVEWLRRFQNAWHKRVK